MSDSHFKVGKLYKNHANIMIFILKAVWLSDSHAELTYLGPDGVVGVAYFTKRRWQPVETTG